MPEKLKFFLLGLSSPFAPAGTLEKALRHNAIMRRRRLKAISRNMQMHIIEFDNMMRDPWDETGALLYEGINGAYNEFSAEEKEKFIKSLAEYIRQSDSAKTASDKQPVTLCLS